MQTKSDAQLLREYAAQRSEPAFAEIVTRHTDLVYSAAWRQTGSPELAREIAQSVFTDLARKARALAVTLTADSSLAGWLYRGTRYAGLTLLRDERRRQAHERQVMEHFDPAPETAPDWARVGPVIDEAMAELGDADREAVLLRFFKNQDFHAVGLALGVSDDAAQKRVSRAVERLREFLAKRGVTVGAHGLGVVITANAIQAAPVGLALTISTTATLAGTTLATTATATAIKTIAMTTLQKTLITAAIVAAVGTGIYEARQASQLRDQVQALLKQQAPLAEQIQQLQRAHEDATQKLAALRDENERLNRNSAELLKLRNQVSQLKDDYKRSQAQSADAEKDPLESEALLLAAKAKVLKQLFEQRPDKKIPELQYLGSQAWLNTAQNADFADLENEAGITKVMSYLRTQAKSFFTQVGLQPALHMYTHANAGQLPTDISQLKPYFGNINPGDDVLPRYQVTRTGNVKDLQPGDIVIAERHPVDENYDTLFQFGLGTWSYHGIGANTNGSGSSGSGGIRFGPASTK